MWVTPVGVRLLAGPHVRVLGLAAAVGLGTPYDSPLAQKTKGVGCEHGTWVRLEDYRREREGER